MLVEKNAGVLKEVTRGEATVSIRKATQAEVVAVRDFVNMESHSYIVTKFLEQLEKEPKLIESLRVPDKVNTAKKVYSQRLVQAALQSIPVDESFVDCVSTDEAASWITAGLSLVATIKGRDGKEQIVAHMAGRELESVVGAKGYFEIKAGVVHHQHRDEEKPASQRLDLQNRNRYLLLKALSEILPDDTYIFSISKQSKVKGPLIYTGFKEKDGVPGKKLQPLELILWDPWTPRAITVAELKRELAKYPTDDDYNAMIARRTEEERNEAITLRTGKS